MISTVVLNRHEVSTKSSSTTKLKEILMYGSTHTKFATRNKVQLWAHEELIKRGWYD